MIRITQLATDGHVVGTTYFALEQGFSVGAHGDNDVVIAGDNRVSRYHGKFEWSRGRDGTGAPRNFLDFHDLDSTNGTIIEIGSLTSPLGRAGGGYTIRLLSLADDGSSWEVEFGGRRTVVQVGHRLSDAEVDQLTVPLARLAIGQTVLRVELCPVAEIVQEFDTVRVPVHAEDVCQYVREIESRERSAALLYSLWSEISPLDDRAETMRRVASTVFKHFSAAGTLTLYESDDHGERTTFAGARNRAAARGIELDPETLARVRDTGEPAFVSKRESGSGRSAVAHASGRLHASICVPLVGRHSTIGLMQVDAEAPAGEFDDDDLKLFALVGRALALILEGHRLQGDIRRMFRGFVKASIKAIEVRDPYTAGHSSRVTAYALGLARAADQAQQGPFAEITFGPEALVELEYGSLLHDFGKVAIPEQLLLKPRKLGNHHIGIITERFNTARVAAARDHAGDEAALKVRLDELLALERVFEAAVSPGWISDEDHKAIRALCEDIYEVPGVGARRLLEPDEAQDILTARGTLTQLEYETIQKHSMLSWKFLSLIPWSEDLRAVPVIARDHHEKLDGSGYPEGRSADEISLAARMVAVADIFDALTASDRPYKTAMTPQRAIEILRKEAAAGQLDTDVVELFVDAKVFLLYHSLVQREGEITERGSKIDVTAE